MATVTIILDDETARRAENYASAHGTSLEALVESYLQDLVDQNRSPLIADSFIGPAERSEASSETTGRTWRRDDLYGDCW